MTTQLPSKERLEEVANNPERYSEIAVAMARALLAAYEQDPYWWAIENRHGDARFVEEEHAKNDIWDEVHELNEKDDNGEYFDDNAPYKVVPVYRRPVLAAYEQEPVAWVMADDLSDNSIISTPAYPSKEDAMEKCIPGVELISLFTHPAPSIPTPPVAQPVMFIDGNISSEDAEKLAKAIREFNEEDERPLAKMARIIRENPHPTNECDMVKKKPAPSIPAVPDEWKGQLTGTQCTPKSVSQVSTGTSVGVVSAPAVPEEMTGGIAMIKHRIKGSNYKQWTLGWNACRAAMLNGGKS